MGAKRAKSRLDKPVTPPYLTDIYNFDIHQLGMNLAKYLALRKDQSAPMSAYGWAPYE